MPKKSNIQLAKDLNLPDRAITESIAVMGRKGSGKTYTGTLLFELFHRAGAQCVALDPVGKWWGLRLSKTGKSAGLDIPVFGGIHGDIPITPESGKMLATVVVERRISCVIDVLLFSKGRRKKFVTDFAEQLFELKKRQHSPLHLFLEEARKFVPQKPMKGDERMLGAFEDIVRLGRNFGLGATLIDQRPQSVNKEVLSQTEILIAHQLVHHLDFKQIRDWVSSNARVGLDALNKLEELEPGHGFFWSPGLMKTFKRIKVCKKRTFDASATPELGDDDLPAPRPLSGGDLEALREGMVEIVEAAEADDPKKLRAKLKKSEAAVKRLTTELSRLEYEATSLAGDLAVLEEQRDERLAGGNAEAELLGYLHTSIQDMDKKIQEVVDGWSSANAKPKAKTNGKPKRRPNRPEIILPATHRRRAKAKPKIVVDESARSELTGPEQRILDAVAWLEVVGVEKPQLVAVAFLAGYRAGGGAFNNPRGRLRAKGFVEYAAGKRIFLTDAGRKIAQPPASIPMTTEGLHQVVLERLGGPERRILTPLLEAYPESLSNAELAKAAGYAIGGAFNNPRGRLRTLGLIEYPESGRAAACDLLFLED